MQAIAVREPEEWLDDLEWHQGAFHRSQVQWGAQEVYELALRWTRGRLVHETPLDLLRLCRQQFALRIHSRAIEDAMIEPLRKASRRLGDVGQARMWLAAVKTLGMTPTDLEIYQRQAINGIREIREVRQVHRMAMPFPNPFIDVWELRQMQAFYAAADAVLEDTICDLVAELIPRCGPELVASMTLIESATVPSLQRRLATQRELRGEPGDIRRIPKQRYEPTATTTWPMYAGH